MKIRALVLAAAVIGTAAIAHQGVQNPAVKARMDSMVAKTKSLETLGQMAKGEIGFDQAAAKEALQKLRAESLRTVDLFRAEETDPKSEARPEIWEDFAQFENHSKELTEVTAKLTVSVQSLESLREGMRSIGRACADCHRDFRVSQ